MLNDENLSVIPFFLMYIYESEVFRKGEGHEKNSTIKYRNNIY